MPRPRVFISSTYYDLKHLRSTLENFVESLGFEPILSEKGDIAYSPDAPLDESCYREATTADIFVLIVGGRYGSAASSEERTPSREFFERYQSITKKEFDAAASRDVPVYILLESSVHSEYQTYVRNRDNEQIAYAHVDSVNVFRLIDDILAKPRNNPVHTFERFAEIEEWLRQQWAGLFRELLQRMSSQQQIATLSAQVETLRAANETLQKYLETVVTKVSPDDAAQMIRTEHSRLRRLQQIEQLRRNPYYGEVLQLCAVEPQQFWQALVETDTFGDFAERISAIAGEESVAKFVKTQNTPVAIAALNRARSIVGKTEIKVESEYAR